MVVVEYENKVARQPEDLVAQSGEDGLELLRRLQGTQEGARAPPEALVDRRDGRYQVQKEARRIVVPLVQRDPGHRKLATLRPVREQSRLAETGRRGDDGQLAPRALIQPLAQARTRHGFRTRTGHVELGPEYLPVHERRFLHRELYSTTCKTQRLTSVVPAVVRDVGGGKLLASVKDADGNVIGLIQVP